MLKAEFWYLYAAQSQFWQVIYSQVCCLLPLREVLLDSHHTVTQSSKSFRLRSFLQRWDRTFTIFDPCSITRTSSSSKTPTTHIHNFKINAPSVCSRCFPVCPTHLLHAVNLKCQVSKGCTYCNSLIMCRPKVVLIFRLYVPATNTFQHCLSHKLFWYFIQNMNQDQHITQTLLPK